MQRALILLISLLSLGCSRSPAVAAQPDKAAVETTSGTTSWPEDPRGLSDADWQARLTPLQYKVLRHAGTERAFSGPHLDNHDHGVFVCAGCGQRLFASGDKFESGTGWPSYTKPISSEAIAEVTDTSLGMARTEVLCARCGGHLGHVFQDGPAPTGERWCINGVALVFEPTAATEEPYSKAG